MTNNAKGGRLSAVLISVTAFCVTLAAVTALVTRHTPVAASSAHRDELDAHERESRDGAEASGHDHEQEHGDHDEPGAHPHGPETEAHEGEEHDHEAEVHEDEVHDHGHDEDAGVVLTPEEIRAFGIVMTEATRGSLDTEIRLPGEVRLNQDRVAHVVPRLAGVVRQVDATLGDRVEKGQTLAVLDSRELAQAKAAYLAARERLHLAQASFGREKGLWEEKISAESEYLEAQNALAEARIAARTAEQELMALGFSAADIRGLAQQTDASLTRHAVVAPFDGVIIEKHITLGEYVEPNTNVFTVADLSTVWVDVNVYQQNLPHIAAGQSVVLSGSNGLPPTHGTIDFVAPVMDRETRTALARVALPNTEGLWRPGLFLDVHLSLPESEGSVVVPKSSVQRIGEDPIVFVEKPSGFQPQIVVLGRGNTDWVEVVSGLEVGQQYVAEGAFELKAKLVTSGMGSHAGHGH